MTYNWSIWAMKSLSEGKMINFPVFERIDISGYGLFPGSEDSEGLHINFQPGLTLVLGANGLGKTTLINIIYRLLTGPFDISGLKSKSEVGYGSITPTRLSYSERKAFAVRVMDGARDARACLSFRLGENKVTIERSLSDLTLTLFSVNDQRLPNDEENTFHVEIPKLAGISSFDDWVLLLHYLVFYFEDRRALVWDASAQRVVFRMLFLPDAIRKSWFDTERDIVVLDSRMRNLRAVLYREEGTLGRDEIKVKKSADIQEELKKLEGLQEIETDLYENLKNELLEAIDAREQARLKMLRAEQEYEAQYRAFERDRLLAIQARFPDHSETARYILANLLVNQDCLVCGNHVPEIASYYSKRVDQAQCVVCGSNLTDSKGRLGNGAPKYDDAAYRVATILKLNETNLKESRRALDEAMANHHSLVARLGELRANINNRSFQIDRLVQQLPPAEAQMYQKRSDLATFRARVEEMKEELTTKRESFKIFIDKVSRNIVKRKDAIKSSFDEYARGFLLDQCQLIWSPKKAPVGQEGILVDYPAFAIDMTGATFLLPQRRSGPEQVSESQREFIDLAFRMALMSVSTDGASSLVMDAPESSLDAVFAPRAAHVFARFANLPSGNCLLITSNLVEGQLIPSLIRGSTTPADRSDRVVDLVKIAAPTVAVHQNRGEYEDIMSKLLAG